MIPPLRPDGIGMVGSLLFAYVYSDVFEVNVKEWRLIADVLCNLALTIDMLLSFFPMYFFELTSLSSVCKSCCGLVAGATRASKSSGLMNGLPPYGHMFTLTSHKEYLHTLRIAVTSLMSPLRKARRRQP